MRFILKLLTSIPCQSHHVRAIGCLFGDLHWPFSFFKFDFGPLTKNLHSPDIDKCWHIGCVQVLPREAQQYFQIPSFLWARNQLLRTTASQPVPKEKQFQLLFCIFKIFYLQKKIKWKFLTYLFTCYKLLFKILNFLFCVFIIFDIFFNTITIKPNILFYIFFLLFLLLFKKIVLLQLMTTKQQHMQQFACET